MVLFFFLLILIGVKLWIYVKQLNDSHFIILATFLLSLRHLWYPKLWWRLVTEPSLNWPSFCYFLNLFAIRFSVFRVRALFYCKNCFSTLVSVSRCSSGREDHCSVSKERGTQKFLFRLEAILIQIERGLLWGTYRIGKIWNELWNGQSINQDWFNSSNIVTDSKRNQPASFQV